MSETSSNNSEYNVMKKKNVSYSTDYLVECLKASDKVKSPSQRLGYEKNVSENSDNKSAMSEGSDINTYITDDKKTIQSPNSYSQSNVSNSNVSNSNVSRTANSENIFEKSFIMKSNENGDENNEEKINPNSNPNSNPNTNPNTNPDYDDYNDLSPEAQMLKKLELLRKLGELAQYGVKLSQNYSMSSDYFRMKYEHQLHTNIRSKQNFINWTSSIMLNCIYGMEILNEKYDPFSLKLTNWSQQINADISSYYDVFGEIYEKYNKPGKSMSPELKLILMIGGSALKFHLNQVASQGKLGMGAMGNAMGMVGMGTNQTLNSNSNSNPNQNQMNLMREQAQLQKMMEETKKQNEILASKSSKEHDLANQQMKDMMFLQQKQEELAKQEAIRKKQMEEFERTKAMFEQQQKLQQAQQTQQSQQSQQPSLAQFHPNQYNQYGGIQNPNQMLNAQRRNDIADHLDHMKNHISNIGNGMGMNNMNNNMGNGMSMNMGLSREQIEQPAHVLYKNTAANVKHRSGTKSNLNVDTSSENSKPSKQSKQSKHNDTQSVESVESANSAESDKSSQSNTSGNASVKSETSSSEPKNSKIEKSLSSRNNYSSISKRKYKKSGINIDTS